MSSASFSSPSVIKSQTPKSTGVQKSSLKPSSIKTPQTLQGLVSHLMSKVNQEAPNLTPKDTRVILLRRRLLWTPKGRSCRV